MPLQTSMVELIEGLASELIDGRESPCLQPHPSAIAADRVRECLHYEDGPGMDLETLAAKTGLSRYQVVRAFKRRYGVPPFSYQLVVRVGRAQRLMKEGLRPAEAAAECGFADQSHFTRHFKRQLGVTPSQYVLA